MCCFSSRVCVKSAPIFRMVFSVSTTPKPLLSKGPSFFQRDLLSFQGTFFLSKGPTCCYKCTMCACLASKLAYIMHAMNNRIVFHTQIEYSRFSILFHSQSLASHTLMTRRSCLQSRIMVHAGGPARLAVALCSQEGRGWPSRRPSRIHLKPKERGRCVLDDAHVCDATTACTMHRA